MEIKDVGPQLKRQSLTKYIYILALKVCKKISFSIYFSFRTHVLKATYQGPRSSGNGTEYCKEFLPYMSVVPICAMLPETSWYNFVF